jgi:hypothetical protein
MLLGGEIVQSLRGCASCRFALVSVSIWRTKLTARERRRDANLTAIERPTCLVSPSPFLTIGLRTPSWQTWQNGSEPRGVQFGSCARVRKCACVLRSAPLVGAGLSLARFGLALSRCRARRSY